MDRVGLVKYAEMEKTKKLYEYKLKSFQDNFENEIKILKDATDVMKNSLELKSLLSKKTR